MRRILLLSALMIYVSSIFAQIPSNYYDDANGLTGDALKNALHNTIDDHTEGSYDLLWTILPESDEDPENSSNFILIYTGRSIPKTSSYPAYNREHVWAKSHGDFGTSAPAGTDAHHLRPSDVDVNSARGNLDFDNGGTLVSGTTGCYSDGDSFEPRDEVKGDVARMMFYMATRYEGDVSGEPDLELVDYITGSTKSPIFGKLSTLLQWHIDDPVDAFERHRNEIVYSYQNNRNPFIDHPEYVCQIWGGDCSTVPSISDITITPANPKSTETVSISATITDDGTIASAKLYWGISSGSLTNTITMSVSTGNTYSIIANIPAQADGVTVYYEIEATDDEAEVSKSSVQSYTIEDNPPITILDEGFETCPATNWTTYSVSGSRNWECGDGSMEINGYNSDVACNDWLISTSFNLNDHENEILKFKSWTQFEDVSHPIEIKFSTDYSGSGDPLSATWNTLNANWSAVNSQVWTESGDIDISGISGTTVYFAFQYISSGTGGGTSAYWKVDDVVISAEEGSSSNSKPQFTNIEHTPIEPKSNETVSISATITDSDGTITGAEVHWGLSSGSLTNTIVMSVSAGNTYVLNTDIPAQANGATVYFEIAATDNEPETSTSVEYNYIVNDNIAITLLEEDFLTCPASTWTTYSVSGSKNWGCGENNMEINAFGSDVACDDWLISPVLNLDSYENEILSFKSLTKYSDVSRPIEIRYSTDYAGSGDPSSFTWLTLTANWSAENSEILTESGDIDISGILGTDVYFAFQYISSGTGGGTSAYWNIDDVLITGTTVASLNEKPVISVITNSPLAPTDADDVTVSATITDDGTISSAKIKWGTTTGVYPNEVSMTNVGDIYSGVIPAQAGGTTVYFLIEAIDDEPEVVTSNENSFSFSTTGNILPEITVVNFIPTDPESTEDVNVTSTITDTDGTISSAKIKWGTTSGDYSNEVTMNVAKGDYSGIIPAQANETHVYFIVYTVDNDGGSAQSAEKDYLVNDPNLLPEITSILNTPFAPVENENVSISANIFDADGTISTVELQWGLSSGSYGNIISMSVSSGNIYVSNSDIPAQSSGTTIYYVIKATDNEPEIATSDEQSFSFTEIPNEKPEISGITNLPIIPTESDDVVIAATITDDSGISSTKIKWGTSTGNTTNVVTMNISKGVYSGIIPAQVGGTNIYYVIEATDDDSEITTSLEKNYSVKVSNVAPEITNISYSPNTPTDAEDVTVSATITDSDGTIESAKIKWGSSTGSFPNMALMTKSGDLYSGIIPAQTGGTTVYYIIEATDNEPETVLSTENNYLVSTTIGIDNILQEKLNIYPNPTNNKINIELDDKVSIKSVQVYNLIGEKILEYNQINESSFKVDLEQFPKGLYIIQVDSPDYTVTKKIMLK
jgi:endonuclease I